MGGIKTLEDVLPFVLLPPTSKTQLTSTQLTSTSPSALHFTQEILIHLSLLFIVRMVHHISFRVADMDKTVEFYLKALGPLGYEKCLAFPGVQSIGLKHHPTIWFQQLTPEDPRGVVNTLHIGIQAKDHAEVDAFYAAAIAAGGKCNGPPGPRPQYTKTYYGAFVFDPEGNNLEAMFMDPVKEAEANAEGCPAAKAQGA